MGLLARSGQAICVSWTFRHNKLDGRMEAAIRRLLWAEPGVYAGLEPNDRPVMQGDRVRFFE